MMRRQSRPTASGPAAPHCAPVRKSRRTARRVRDTGPHVPGAGAGPQSASSCRSCEPGTNPDGPPAWWLPLLPGSPGRRRSFPTSSLRVPLESVTHSRFSDSQTCSTASGLVRYSLHPARIASTIRAASFFSDNAIRVVLPRNIRWIALAAWIAWARSWSKSITHTGTSAFCTSSKGCNSPSRSEYPCNSPTKLPCSRTVATCTFSAVSDSRRW